jgi:hypothetical protein
MNQWVHKKVQMDTRDDMTKLVHAIRDLEELYHAKFLKLFKVPLRKFLHFKNYGFDVVAFDDYLKVPDGTSLNQFVQQKHGKRALAMIENLLKVGSNLEQYTKYKEVEGWVCRNFIVYEENLTPIKPAWTIGYIPTCGGTLLYYETAQKAKKVTERILDNIGDREEKEWLHMKSDVAEYVFSLRKVEGEYSRMNPPKNK